MRSVTSLAVVGLLVAKTPTSSASDDVVRETRIAAPNVQLEGKTDGNAEFHAGFGVRTGWAWGANWDVTYKLDYKIATTDALATLVSVVPGKEPMSSNPWELGVAATWADMTPPKYPPEAMEQGRVIEAAGYNLCASRCKSPSAQDKKFCDSRRDGIKKRIQNMSAPPPKESFCAAQQATVADLSGLDASKALEKRVEAAEACLKTCDVGSTESYCQTFDADSRAFKRGDFCPDGEALIAQFEKGHPELTSRYPRKIINVGVRAGGVKYKFLEAEADDATRLKSTSTVRYPITTGASGIFLRGFGHHVVTLEGLATLSRASEEAEDKARWCAPAGNVVLDDGTTAPAGVCKDTPLGRPSIATKGKAGLFVGVFDEVLNKWRIAAGVEGDRPLAGTGSSSLALKVPVTFVFAATEDKDAYKGLIRVTPSATWKWNAKGELETTYGLALSLLGQRSMFSESFDKL